MFCTDKCNIPLVCSTIIAQCHYWEDCKFNMFYIYKYMLTILDLKKSTLNLRVQFELYKQQKSSFYNTNWTLRNDNIIRYIDLEQFNLFRYQGKNHSSTTEFVSLWDKLIIIHSKQNILQLNFMALHFPIFLY